MKCTARIRRITYYFPPTTLSNNDLIESMGIKKWSEDDIYQKTGIIKRHIVQPNETALDLGIQAVKKMFDDNICSASEIDFLLFCTQSPDYFLPASACIMHDKLGLNNNCGALDYNQGCSGYIYGLSLAKGLIESGNAKNVLLVTSETYSKFINKKDRSTRTIFGDGAAATLIGAVESDHDFIGSMVFGTNGKGAPNLIVTAGGMRLPLSDKVKTEFEDEDGNIRSQANLYMNGPEIFNFALQVVPKTVQEVLSKVKLGIEDIDYFVFHQANKFMLEHLRKKMKIMKDKFWVDLSECGNTVSASIPIAVRMAMDAGKIKTGDYVMLVGFGVGYSWGACLIKI
ncbi:3-oxoacyl-ACP synthase III family protein [Sporomusa acidovorans]|uniref:3-oxoacyl-[acyl-carrier-protein] synthase 3 n=1 Tax=Sporomusa acidovorans (strain ATCC 49682 / DSM 3132 / Mol) TaxID=1123286 RepID=A0ABZ3IXL9_SPOA4|nr:ketoacyl-ACP synthase III [Sporomusa acidovorans]OZC22421.1 3-oxoacyl-[acyl-carrier-protein] synthase 3 [Sporomusa acidovorans DSM 3132]SDE48759.1 3-oxoacyl-[acyl-carrier-protein] synthase-3 [Sporomusa acidovorans]